MPEKGGFMLIKYRLDIDYCCKSMMNVTTKMYEKDKEVCIYVDIVSSNCLILSKINYCPFCGKEIIFDLEKK